MRTIASLRIARDRNLNTASVVLGLFYSEYIVQGLVLLNIMTEHVSVLNDNIIFYIMNHINSGHRISIEIIYWHTFTINIALIPS